MRKEWETSSPTCAVCTDCPRMAITTRDQDNTAVVLVQAAHVGVFCFGFLGWVFFLLVCLFFGIFFWFFFGGGKKKKRKKCFWLEGCNIAVTLRQCKWLCREEKNKQGKLDFKSTVANNKGKERKAGRMQTWESALVFWIPPQDNYWQVLHCALL